MYKFRRPTVQWGNSSPKAGELTPVASGIFAPTFWKHSLAGAEELNRSAFKPKSATEVFMKSIGAKTAALVLGCICVGGPSWAEPTAVPPDRSATQLRT